VKRITPHDERLHLARTFIDHHYHQPITLEHVSQEAGYSPYHFIRLFHSAYRQTPHQYLMQQRIEQAKVLLRTSELPIRGICFAVGFESLGSFTTLFRRTVGLSPGSYRKRACGIEQPASIPLCHRFMLGITP
jgi:AraC-like DNA-binding protein